MEPVTMLTVAAISLASTKIAETFPQTRGFFFGNVVKDAAAAASAAFAEEIKSAVIAGVQEVKTSMLDEIKAAMAAPQEDTKPAKATKSA